VSEINNPCPFCGAEASTLETLTVVRDTLEIWGAEGVGLSETEQDLLVSVNQALSDVADNGGLR